MPFDPFGEDDPFEDQQDDWISSQVPVTIATNVTVQLPCAFKSLVSSALDRDLPIDDKVEQHVLHSIFADGVASEVPLVC